LATTQAELGNTTLKAGGGFIGRMRNFGGLALGASKSQAVFASSGAREMSRWDGEVLLAECAVYGWGGGVST
jgi:hypothetical protein